MYEQITLQVPNRVVRQAAFKASQYQRQVEDILTEWLERAATELPVEELTDDEVLALTKLQLSLQQQTALSELLSRNREDEIDAAERRELDELMRLYEYGLLRKAQALRVAVQRGLREPLQA